MKYKLGLSKKADKQLSKLDKTQSKIIVAWLRKNIKDTENPRSYGGPLTENHKGKWKYRIGSYRVIVDIRDDQLIVLALEIGHRREVYK